MFTNEGVSQRTEDNTFSCGSRRPCHNSLPNQNIKIPQKRKPPQDETKTSLVYHPIDFSHPYKYSLSHSFRPFHHRPTKSSLPKPAEVILKFELIQLSDRLFSSSWASTLPVASTRSCHSVWCILCSRSLWLSPGLHSTSLTMMGSPISTSSTT